MKFNAMKVEDVFFQMQLVSLKKELPNSRYKLSKLFDAENFIR